MPSFLPSFPPCNSPSEHVIDRYSVIIVIVLPVPFIVIVTDVVVHVVVDVVVMVVKSSDCLPIDSIRAASGAPRPP